MSRCARKRELTLNTNREAARGGEREQHLGSHGLSELLLIFLPPIRHLAAEQERGREAGMQAKDREGGREEARRETAREREREARLTGVALRFCPSFFS